MFFQVFAGAALTCLTVVLAYRLMRLPKEALLLFRHRRKLGFVAILVTFLWWTAWISTAGWLAGVLFEGPMFEVLYKIGPTPGALAVTTFVSIAWWAQVVRGERWTRRNVTPTWRWKLLAGICASGWTLAWILTWCRTPDLPPSILLESFVALSFAQHYLTRPCPWGLKLKALVYH